MTAVDKFLEAIAEQGKIGKKPCKKACSSSLARGLYGRIVRTRAEKPTVLAEEPERLAVMVMGPGSLRCMVGLSGYEMVVAVGHTREYIEAKLAAGYKYHLVAFRKPEGELKLATWNNVIALAIRLYPAAKERLLSARGALKAHSFADFEAASGFSLAAVDLLGASHERFMTLERFLKADVEHEALPGLAARRFLYHILRLSELYSGDGYTRTHEGKRGVREYIVANRTLDKLPDCRSLELSVKP
jgi:hypothetical protein